MTAAAPYPAVYAVSGVFVCFEGGEGSGKSTQARLLSRRLEEEGYAVRLTFEPGDTPVGQELRRIVLSPETGSLSPRTEALLYIADKAEHVDTLVQPALDRGEVVITDRYVDSTLAYQGAGRDLAMDGLEQVARWATHGLRPHLTVVLDLAQEQIGGFQIARGSFRHPLARHQHRQCRQRAALAQFGIAAFSGAHWRHGRQH